MAATEALPVSSEARPRSPEEIERDWFENVYQGDHMPQLTVRALIMGMLLGAIMSISNVYVGLKAGWGLGVAITSRILAFAIFQTLHVAFHRLPDESGSRRSGSSRTTRCSRARRPPAT